MKNIILTFILLSTLPLSASTDIEYREFKSLDGKTIQARIISGNQKTIKLELKDRRKFDVNVSLFSAEDREYIKKWAEENALNNIDLKITASASKGKATTTGSIQKITKTPAFYKITIANKGYEKIEGLTAKYFVYMSPDGNSSAEDKKEYQLSGSYFIDELDKRTEHQFDTKGFILYSSKLKAGYKYESGGSRTADTLRGVWIRIYKGEKIVAEYANPPPLKKKGWYFSEEKKKEPEGKKKK